MDTQAVDPVSLVQVSGKVDLGNVCEVWRGQVIDGSGRTMEAYIKHLPSRAVFIECIAAQIGRSIGLSVPRPLLVKVEPVRLPELRLKKPSIFFGSEDAGYPSLQQIASVDRIMEKLRDWPRALQAGCFDEWIANADRHHGNILIQGNGNFSLIDHSHAIPIDHQPNTPNRRNTFLCAASPSDKDELGIHRAIKGAKKELSNFVELAQKDWHKLSRPELYCEPEKSKQVVSFLNDRLTILSILIGKKLGDRQQDLYANNG